MSIYLCLLSALVGFGFASSGLPSVQSTCSDASRNHSNSATIDLCVDIIESAASGLSLLQKQASKKPHAFHSAAKISRNVPRIIMQTYKNSQGNHTQKWLMLNPGWKYYFLDDQSALEFLKGISNELSDAYETIIPGAVKADLLRLAWLWKHGGVYADQDLSPQELDPYLNKADLYMLQSDLTKQNCSDQIYNAFMVAAPQSSILKWALDRSLANVQGRFRGDDDTCFGIAGPIVIAQVLREAVPSFCDLNRCRGERTPVLSDGSCAFEMGSHYHTITGEILLLEKEGDVQLKRFFKDPDPGIKYTSLCKEGKVFRELLGENMYQLQAGYEGFAPHTIMNNPYALRRHRRLLMD